MIALLLRLLTGVRARYVAFDPASADTTRCRVFFANHTSHLDAAVIWAALPPRLRAVTRPVAAADYWSTGIRGRLASQVFRAVLVERKKVARSNNALSAMQAAIARGDSLIVFPEGTRADCDADRFEDFKPGIYHLARRCPGLELVPVYLENLNRMLPKGKFFFIPLLATAYFGPPMRLEPGERKESFLARARGAIEALRAHGPE